MQNEVSKISSEIILSHMMGSEFDKEKLLKTIEKEKLNDIYKRYYRATNEQGGFGIGLNIVNDICSFYKIKIIVESQINEGTTFTLTF